MFLLQAKDWAQDLPWGFSETWRKVLQRLILYRINKLTACSIPISASLWKTVKACSKTGFAFIQSCLLLHNFKHRDYKRLAMASKECYFQHTYDINGRGLSLSTFPSQENLRGSRARKNPNLLQRNSQNLHFCNAIFQKLAQAINYIETPHPAKTCSSAGFAIGWIELPTILLY